MTNYSMTVQNALLKLHICEHLEAMIERNKEFLAYRFSSGSITKKIERAGGGDGIGHIIKTISHA